MSGDLAVELLFMASLILLVAALFPWRKPPRPRRHHEALFDGTHATCSCGYNRYDDWDLSKHLKEES